MPASIITSTFLQKLGKHSALLVCLLIVGQVSNRYEVGQATILGLAIGSSLLHLAGRALQMRFVLKIFRNGLR